MNKKYNFSPSTNSGMMLVLSFLALWGANTGVLAVMNAILPSQFVLGTMTLSPAWALFMSMGALALAGMLSIPVFHEIEQWRARELTPTEWMMGYLVVNVVALWGVTRFAEQFGFGVSAWYYLVLLAGVVDIAQGAVMMLLEKWRVSTME